MQAKNESGGCRVTIWPIWSPRGWDLVRQGQCAKNGQQQYTMRQKTELNSESEQARSQITSTAIPTTEKTEGQKSNKPGNRRVAPQRRHGEWIEPNLGPRNQNTG
jgi:hypothetical protein